MIVNKTPADLDPAQIRAQVEATYGAHVSAVLPHSDRMMQLGSSGVFALEFPDDPITEQLRRTARELIAASEVAS
jgi:hypothetical protein